MQRYFDFLKYNGHNVAEYLESKELALSYTKTKEALEILNNIHCVVLGGDVFVRDNTGELDYAMNVLGQEYHCFNWFFDGFDALQSYKKALEAVEIAVSAVSKNYSIDVFFVLTIR